MFWQSKCQLLTFYPYSQGLVNGAGQGAGTVNAHGASGAGHGGYGGKGNLQDIRGSYYNSLLKPAMFGSSGGGGKTVGGGVLRVDCKVFKLDGDIKVNGQSGLAVSGSFNGGASGGSVWVTTSELSGSGSVSADGGSGDSFSGGGSGGRIALHYSSQNKFEGAVTAYGGDSTHETGAAGTVVLVNDQTGATNLTVANKGRKPSSSRITDFTRLNIDAARTWVPLDYSSNKPKYASLVIGSTGTDYRTEHAFTVLKLGGSSHIAFEQSRLAHTSVMVINRLIGTYEGKSFGYIHAAARQFIVVLESDFYVPVNLQVYSGGAVQLPSKVMLHGNNLNLEGSLAGIKELTVSAGVLRVSSSSKVGYYLTGSPGFDLSKLSVFAEASIVAATTSMTSYMIKSTTLDVQAGGKISGRLLEIETTTCYIKDSAALTVDFGGFAKTLGRGSGPTDFRAKESCGGSHAGFGGKPSTVAYGTPYGNMFQPSLAGSGGGGLSAVSGGGEGGGSIKITAVSLTVDGDVTAR